MSKAGWDASLLPPGGRVVVGFSGGADSTALAHWLLGQVGAGRLLLAHVNHCLRGPESDRDEAHVRAFAERFGVEIQVRRVDVAALAQKQGLGLEECGRQVRYAFFDSLAPGPGGCICTAHTADDNAETLLLHLLRGASLQGLCGIPAKRGKIRRPLLGVTRQEVEDYCGGHGLPYVTDSTNADTDYTRNRLRQQVMPILKEMNPRFVEACGRAMGQLSADRDCLEAQAAALLGASRRPFGLDCGTLRAAPPSLQSRALRQYLEAAGCHSLEEKHVKLAQALLGQDGAMSLPGGVRAESGLGLFYAHVPGDFTGYAVPVGLGETRLPGGKRLVLGKKTAGKGQIHGKIQNLLFKNALDYATIYPKGPDASGLIARTPRPGDRFAPCGRGVTKPLGRVLREAGVPSWARGRALLLELGGQVVYCQGAGAAEGFGAKEEGCVLTVEITEGRMGKEEDYEG